MRIALIAALAFVLTGCVSGGGPTYSTETYLTITESGAGPVNGSTRYSEAAIKEALPWAEVRGITAARENSTAWTLAAYRDGIMVIQLYKGSGGKIGEIHGVTQHLTGPNGERIGMSLAQAGVSRSSCRVGRNLWRGMAVCPARGADNVTLVFAIPGYRGPFDSLPSASDLKKAELQRIVWKP
ncbi:DUF1131 family protein [Amorphus coralli]|uniref:DUF1131 family protein n=1 Tax=Amorphus coralli TaxID=340680 RepID=UPI00037320C4|nr:DUF1131 family protein [Amorphus coralli]